MAGSNFPEVSCVHGETCAGCPLLPLPYAEQLVFKENRLRTAIERFPSLHVAIEKTAPAEPREGYRTRAKLMVSIATGSAGGRALPIVGLYARSEPSSRKKPDTDHQVVDIPECRVLSPRLAHVATGLRALLRKPPRDAGPCLVPEEIGGYLSAFDLRDVDGDRPGVLVTIVLRAGHEPPRVMLESAANAVRDVAPDVLGIAVNYRSAKNPQVLGSSTRVLWGAEQVRDRSGTAYQIASYGSFVQAHRGQADRIAALLASALSRAGLPPSLRLLDLYAGSGALSLGLAKSGAKVTLVESFRPAASAAARAAEEQHIADFTVRPGDAGQVLGALAREGAKFDAVLANPPRRGLAPDVRKRIAELTPRAIAYVSCEPEALARDLAHFANLGYAAERLSPVDMIPLTDQVETVAVLVPTPAPSFANAFADDDVRVAEKPAYIAASASDLPIVWSSPEETSGFTVWARAPIDPAPRQNCLVLARGPMAAEGRIGKKSNYVRLAKLNGHSLIHVMFERSTVLDLRRDLARSGHHVIGDRACGHEPTNRHFEERYLLDRPFFHCFEISLSHPRTRSTLTARSALPGELGTVLTRLGPLALDVAKRLMVG
ncbi:MAG: RsmD family RNA methyltransferase [Polyangiaceae bacterium]